MENYKKFQDVSTYIRRPQKVLKLIDEHRTAIESEVTSAPRFSGVSRVSVQGKPLFPYLTFCSVLL